MRRSACLCALLCLLPGLLLAQGTEAYFSPYDDPEARALAILDGAQHTVDVAQYNIRNRLFYDKLLELKQRNVQVRIVVDAKNAAKEWNTLDDEFEQAGFEITRYENTSSKMAIMHHKFTIVDDALVMTGSYNWNLTAQVTNDENMVVIRDPGIVAGYRNEYAELRGEAPETLGPALGAGAKVYFSPEDDVRQVIKRAIDNAQRRVLVSVFTFRDSKVARALRDAAQRGVEVWLVTEKKQADNTRADEIVAEAEGARVIVAANRSAAYSAMHHKFCVIDEATVITGACNWTYTAFNHSNEDLLVVSDSELAARYTAAFGALVRRYAPDLFLPASFGIDAAEGWAHVVVSAPSLDRQAGGELFLVGDHPALGEWDPARAVPLRTSNGLQPSWGGRVRLPAGARVEWKTIAKFPSGDVQWETGPNHVAIMDAAGTNSAFFVDFGGSRRVQHLFQVTCAEPLPKDAQLVISGDVTTLGDWDPAKALALEPTDETRTTWRGRVELPVRTRVGFKALLLEGDVATWEAGPDHVAEIPKDASWTQTRSVFVRPLAPAVSVEAPAEAPSSGGGISGAIPGQ